MTQDVHHVDEVVHLLQPQLEPQEAHHRDGNVHQVPVQLVPEDVNHVEEQVHKVPNQLLSQDDEQDIVLLQAETQDVHLPPTETPGPRRSRRIARRKFDNLCEENLF